MCLPSIIIHLKYPRLTGHLGIIEPQIQGTGVISEDLEIWAREDMIDQDLMEADQWMEVV